MILLRKTKISFLIFTNDTFILFNLQLIIKVLNSAVANAVNNFGAKKEDLVIKETYISEGRTLKRSKAASHSRVAKNYHRTSHIYVCVTDNMEKKED